MLPNILADIFTEESGTQHCAEREATLERHMDNLIAHHHLLRSSLMDLLKLEQQGAAGEETMRYNFAMDIIYLTSALVISGYATEADNAAVVLNVVERYLLIEGSTAYLHLRGYRYALQRCEQILNGYVILLDMYDKMNYSRKLYYLQRAVYCFKPSPDHITIAHSILVREAKRICYPYPALIIMRQPILEMSPIDTGVSLTSLYSYYCHGGLLLASMHCWEDAVGWLRICISLLKRTSRVTLSENTTTIESACSTTTNTTLTENRGSRDVLITATKAFILVCIIFQGEFIDIEDRKRVQRVMQQFRGSHIDPYFRLLSAAAQRDIKLWKTLEKHFESLWKQDEMTSLVFEAGTRLRRHVIRDIAKVASRVYLSDIMFALRSHFILGVSNMNETEEASAIIQLLICMQEEKELVVSLEHITIEEGNREKIYDMEWKRLAVRLSLPPRRLSAELGSSSYEWNTLCLSDADEYIKKRFKETLLRRSILERMSRYHRVHAALIRATGSTCGGNVQPVEHNDGQS